MCGWAGGPGRAPGCCTPPYPQYLLMPQHPGHDHPACSPQAILRLHASGRIADDDPSLSATRGSALLTPPHVPFCPAIFFSDYTNGFLKASFRKTRPPFFFSFSVATICSLVSSSDVSPWEASVGLSDS